MGVMPKVQRDILLGKCFWLLVIGFWLLVIGFWFLVFGFWFLVFGSFVAKNFHKLNLHSML
jgi:hypothetical protein